MDSAEEGLIALQSSVTIDRPQNIIIKNRLTSEYQSLYEELVSQSLRDFPPIKGYETIHTLLVERFVWFYVQQKMDDNKLEQEVNWKGYKTNTQAFLRTCDNLLREAKAIGAEQSFKAGLIKDVMEVIDRCIPDKATKRLVVQELGKVSARNKPPR